MKVRAFAVMIVAMFVIGAIVVVSSPMAYACGAVEPCQSSSSTSVSSTTTSVSSITSTVVSTTSISSTVSISPPTGIMLQHVAPTTGCAANMIVPTAITAFDATPVALDSKGQNSWQIQMQTSDAVHGDYFVTFLSVVNGAPTTTGYALYHNGVSVQSQTVNVPSGLGQGAGKLIKAQFVDFYFDGDSPQVFWYDVGASSQLFSYNFQPFPSTLNFVSTDIAVAFVPTNGASNVSFGVLAAHTELGQQKQTSIPGIVQVSDFQGVGPCAVQNPIPNSNACGTNAGAINGGISFRENWIN